MGAPEQRELTDVWAYEPYGQVDVLCVSDASELVSSCDLALVWVLYAYQDAVQDVAVAVDAAAGGVAWHVAAVVDAVEDAAGLEDVAVGVDVFDSAVAAAV